MELGVMDRLMLRGVLPEKGDVLTIRIIHELRQRLSFSENEIEEMGIKQDDGRITWSSEDRKRNIEIGPKAKEVIRKALEDLSAKHELTEQHIPLCELFEVGKEG